MKIIAIALLTSSSLAVAATTREAASTVDAERMEAAAALVENALEFSRFGAGILGTVGPSDDNNRVLAVPRWVVR